MPFWSNWSKQCKLCTLLGVIGVLAISITLWKVNSRQNSSIDCENKDDLYFRGTDYCYPKGTRGPCSETMILLEKDPSKPTGQGKCNCPYTEHQRPLLFHREKNHCYFIFSQGFCEDGFWLNVTRPKGDPVCEENTCLSQFEGVDVIPDEIVPLKGGRCGILNQPVEGCREDETLHFVANHIYPTCKDPKVVASGFVSGVPSSPCPLGSFASIVGKCQPEFEF